MLTLEALLCGLRSPMVMSFSLFREKKAIEPTECWSPIQTGFHTYKTHLQIILAPLSHILWSCRHGVHFVHSACEHTWVSPACC